LAKAQLPIDGKLGKNFKITSPMGNRIHPVTKEKKHHNGSDVWSGQEPCWIEAPFDGKVLEAKKSTAAGGGFGNYVKLLHNINGKWYTTLYAHMADGLKVKVGQKIEAGTILGKMASTGMSTGKHLHWELKEGKDHAWNNTGKGYIEPFTFFNALIAVEAAAATASVETKDSDPVLPAPIHGAKPAVVTPATAKPAAKKTTSATYTVKSGDTLSKIATQHKTTVAALVSLNAIKDASKINVGQVIKLK
jgi:murein DD-endopeptidase MepM/ murein hydrolase activator NlpD